MNIKIQKYQLVILFILSVLNVIFYYYGNHLPDNSFVISSGSENMNSVSYNFYSILAVVSYYIGPWIVMPFFAYAFFYTFVISKRDKDVDIIVPVALCLFFYCFSFLLFPQLIGKGIMYLSVETFSTYTFFFSTVFFGISVFALTLRGTFFSTLRIIQGTSEAFGYKILKLLEKSFKYSKNKFYSTKIDLKKVNIHQKAISFVKDGAGKIKRSSINDEEPLSANPTINSEEEQIITPRMSETIDTEKETVSDNTSDPIEKKKNVQVRASRVPSFFKSRDLIDCIKTNPNLNNPKSPDSEYFDQITNAVEQKLNEFKIDCKIINVLKGPVVDTFELELGEGVKLSKIQGLSDDIGLALNGQPIRMVYPMRGRPTVGIEVPRNPREFIFLDEVLKTKEFDTTNHRLPVAMGKDAFGEVKIVDLAGMPHMLVAGATGAGKSVFINTLLVSLITKKSPRELRLVLIDPKQLELALYEKLPHLMLPIITEPNLAAISLLWLVQEMDRRYSILKELGVKNLDGFNSKVKKSDKETLQKINKFYEDSPDEGYELPYIVCVIDEFADLVLSKSGKEIEVNVNRLAAKARAAGIHMVVATQRPSTDVITGVIKANFPTRVAFTVTTGHDSKTILDKYGAEKLLKRGDMLFKQGTDLLRLHSAYVEEDEIEGLVDKLATLPNEFNQQAIDFLENGGDDLEHAPSDVKVTFVSGTTSDPVYQEAIEIVMERGSASASMLQRALRVGYNRAANIIDELEKNGIVGPAQGSKPRKVISRM